MTADSRSTCADPGLPDFLCFDGEPAWESTQTPTGRVVGHIPGEGGVWIFILGDMTLFGAILAAVMWERHRRPAFVADSAAHLQAGFGATNTIVLLVSSYLVVWAIHAHRSERHRVARGCVIGALVCAGVFVVLKTMEYGYEFRAGFTPWTNVFFTYYFALTGLHLLHVIIGAVLLTWWWRMARHNRPWPQSRVSVEAIAVYWHMVDLLWIAIFTLVYLVCAQ
jgi:nitric oxide reductase NorE protein